MWNNCLVKVHFKFANHSISKYLSNNTSTYLEHSLVNKHYLKACYTLRRLGSFLSVRSSYQCLVCLFFARHQSTKLQCATVGQSVFISNNVECCCYRLIPLSDRGLHGSRVKVKETWLMNWNWCDGYPVWSWKRSLARWEDSVCAQRGTVSSPVCLFFNYFIWLFTYRSSTCCSSWTTRMKRFDLSWTAGMFWTLSRTRVKRLTQSKDALTRTCQDIQFNI